MRTIAASGLPPIAIHNTEMGADRRKRPAIVQGKNNGNIISLCVIHKQADIHVTAVQIVQMYDIRSILIDLFQKPFGTPIGKAALVHRILRQLSMDAAIGTAADFHNARLLVRAPNGGSVFYAVFFTDAG